MSFDINGWQAIYIAAAQGNHKALEKFAKQGMDLTKIEPAGGEGGVLVEAMKGYRNVTSSLMAKVAQLQAGGFANAFGLGVFGGVQSVHDDIYLKTMRVLLDAGANVNGVDGPLRETPLMIASDVGFREAVDTLLKNGADRAAKDSKGRTAADYATAGGSPDIAAYLSGAAPVLKKICFRF